MWTEATKAMSKWSSLRLGDGPVGAIGTLLVGIGIILIPIVTPFTGTALIWILLIVFPSAIFSALYSLFFERSKFYAMVTCVLATMAFLIQPFTWYFAKLYLPLVAVFCLFCTALWLLKSRRSN